MKKILLVLILSLLPSLAFAQTTRNPCYTSQSPTAAGITNCIGVGTSTPLPVTNTPSGTQTISGTVTANQGTPAAVANAWPVAPQPYPSGATPLSGNASGTTGAVVGTLAAGVGVTTYICGFNVQSVGGAASSGPIVVAGLVGASQTYQAVVNGASVSQVASATFTPCIPASATNTAITVTTTANGTATAVNVNSWGYRQ